MGGPVVKVGGPRADMTYVSTSRCPHCSALLARGAEWCSLCLADLRPSPEPVTEPVTEPQAADPDAHASIDPASVRPRGRHARRPDEAAGDGPARGATTGGASGLAASLTAIRAATSLDPAEADRSYAEAPGPLDLDDLDLSMLAGAGNPTVIDEWSLKAQAPGAKIWLMVAGVAVVGGAALLLLTVAGLVIG